MEQKKLYFAINNKDFEDIISSRLRDDVLVVGATTYREAILEGLYKTNADILVFREALKGSIPLEDLLKEIRIQFPKLQFILILNNRPVDDPVISYAVCLGIYDIINSSGISPDELVSMIREPRNFSHVAGYFKATSLGFQTGETEVKKEEPKKRGLFGRSKQKEAPQQSTKDFSEVEVQKVNLDTLRSAIREEAIRDAQKDMDALIEKAVIEKTVEFKKEISDLEKIISNKDAIIKNKESHVSELSRELSLQTSLVEQLEKDKTELSRKMSEGFAAYEESIKGLQSISYTPEWYKEKEAEWKAKETAYLEKLDELSKKITQ